MTEQRTHMLTPGLEYLLKTVDIFLHDYNKSNNNVPVLLNVGAGKSILIEKQLAENGNSFVCDRVELEEVQVSGYGIRDCYQCSVEDMHQVKSEEYHAAFANYVLEHVKHLNETASEIYRVMKPGGIFVASIPNPVSLEFLIARITPTWFHRLVRGEGEEVFETHYSFRGIRELCKMFQKSGFKTNDIYYRSCLFSYLQRFSVINKLAVLYDHILNTVRIKRLMDYVCVVFQKPLK